MRGADQGCGVNTTVNLGSRQDPKLVFSVAMPARRAGLTVHRGIKGAGILVVQDGALNNHGSLEWTGSSSSPANPPRWVHGQQRHHHPRRGGRLESNAGAAFGSFDFSVDGAIRGLSIRSSQQTWIWSSRCVRCTRSRIGARSNG